MKPSLLICLVMSAQLAWATHIAGGYIQSKAVAEKPLTYEITVNLFLNEYSGKNAIDGLSSITLCFGDGTTGVATRMSRSFTSTKQYSVDTYPITHTFPGPGAYSIQTTLANRTSCVNIPSANTLLFTVSTTILTNTSTPNQTPTVNLPQGGSYIGLNHRTVISLAATDNEGDSLAYNLAVPSTSSTLDECDRKLISTYQFPNDVTKRGIFKLNNQTGELTWDAPVKEGTYSVVLTIGEYRNGVLISETTQELLFIVADLANGSGIIPPYEPATDGLIVTAAAQEEANRILTIFPNPVDDQLQVVVQMSTPTPAIVRLLDATGRKLHELTFTREARKHEQAISMSSLTPGIYLIQADIGGRLIQRKVVKR